MESETVTVMYMGAKVTMPTRRAHALLELGQATQAPETAAAKAPRTADRPRGKTRTATRKPKGGKS